MLTKEKVLTSVQSLPEHFSIDDLMEKLIIIEKIETGIEQLSKGQVYSQEEVKEKVQLWRK
ncbi:MAG: hypothetical protein ACOYOA_07460 [Saprospiraceae bacterium]